jgi:hypothetical protein
MHRLVTFMLVGLVAATLASTATGEPTQNGQKVWLCHKTGSTFSTTAGTFTKFVAVRVGAKAVAPHLRHGDVAVSPAPTGTLKAQRQAAKEACAALRRIAPITPSRGGKALDVTLTGSGITASLTARTQVGQQRLCFALDVTGPVGSTVQLTSLTLSQGSMTVTVPPAGLTGADPSGCMTLASRALANQILAGGFTATLSGSVTPSGGAATPFQLTGTLSR